MNLVFKKLNHLLMEIVFNQKDYNWNGYASDWDLMFEQGDLIPEEFDNVIEYVKETIEGYGITEIDNINDLDTIRFYFDQNQLYLSINCLFRFSYTAYIPSGGEEDEEYNEEDRVKNISGSLMVWIKNGKITEVDGYYYREGKEEQFEIHKIPDYQPTQEEEYPEDY
jgi:hypothetical protein